MANVSNNMLITSEGLTKISRELLNKRKFSKDLIQVIGNPIITDGVASSLSPLNYFKQNIEIEEQETIRVFFKGVFAPVNDSSELCSWSLLSSDKTESLLLAISENSFKLLLNDEALFYINNIKIDKEDVIQATITLNTDSYKVLLFVNDKVIEEEGILDDTVDLSKFTEVQIGNSEVYEKYWEGDVYLTDFSIYKNDKMYYTPSVANIFKFTKLLVGDGSFPLNNNSVPILNHVYECPITEISRSNNNILLTSQIGSDDYLNIQEVGLYSTGEDGTQLFSLISGLSVRKSSDLGYNLLIHVNLDLNVVNTSILPEIIINEKDYSKFKDFTTIQQVYAYINANLERMIKLNALGLGNYTNETMTELKPSGVGYNKAQVLCRLQDKIKLWEDGVSTSLNYSKVRERFKHHVEEYFSTENLEKHGNVILSKSGEATLFSNLNYVTSNTVTLIPEEWEFTASFKPNFAYTNDQVILCLDGKSNFYSPLTLGMREGFAYASVARKEQVRLKIANSFTLYDRNGTYINDETEYFEWINPVTSSKVFTTDRVPSGESSFYDSGFDLISNIQEVTFVGGHIFSNNLFPIAAGQKYWIKVNYVEGEYSIKYSTDNKSYINIYSVTDKERIAPVEVLYVGVSPFQGLGSFAGTVYLKDFRIESHEVEGLAKNTVVSKFFSNKTVNLNLLDYFHIPDYNHSFFYANNLAKLGSRLNVYEGNIKGENDSIDFNKAEGFSICAKVLLGGLDDKVLLAKGNLEEERFYFILEEENESIIFTLYTGEGIVRLSYKMTELNFRKFTENPITITVTYSGRTGNPELKMYKNNQLLATTIPSFTSLPSVEYFYLTNEKVLGLEEERRVFDILSFDGELKENDIYYINNILDTNF